MKLFKGSVYYPNKDSDGPVKYLCFTANPLDAEIMAINGIQKGYRARKYRFANVICGTGENLLVNPKLKKLSGQYLKGLHTKEAKKSADYGRFQVLYLLKYDDIEIKDQENSNLVSDMIKIIKEHKPSVIYTYSVLDKNPIHLSVTVKVINALRSLKKKDMPRVLYGMEMDRDFDWIDPSKLIYFNVSKNMRLQRQLLTAQKSLVTNGKNIIDSTFANRYSCATKMDNNNQNKYKLAVRGINMTTLLRRKELPIKKYAMSFVDYLYQSINDDMDRSL